jgi:hypothetical protein
MTEAKIVCPLTDASAQFMFMLLLTWFMSIKIIIIVISVEIIIFQIILMSFILFSPCYQAEVVVVGKGACQCFLMIDFSFSEIRSNGLRAEVQVVKNTPIKYPEFKLQNY